MVVMSSLFEQFLRTTGRGSDAFAIAIIVSATALIAPLFTLFRRGRPRDPTPPGGLPFFGHTLSLMDTDEDTNSVLLGQVT